MTSDVRGKTYGGDRYVDLGMTLLIEDEKRKVRQDEKTNLIGCFQAPGTHTTPTNHVGYVRIIGATTRSIRLLEKSGRSVSNIKILDKVPKYEEPISIMEMIDCIDLKEVSKKKKRKKRNKNKRADDEVDAEEIQEADKSASSSCFDQTGCSEQSTSSGVSEQSTNSCCSERSTSECSEQPKSEGPTTSEVRGIAALKSEKFLDKNFEFKRNSIQAAETRISSWEDLKILVTEVFPNDPEVNTALEKQSQDSFDLWNFIVKYGRMYKEFVGEVLDMVNELKRALHETVELHREKTKEVLISHKKEMALMKEKARKQDVQIDTIVGEVHLYRQLCDDQRVKIFSQEEELETLKKEQVTREKTMRNFENMKKSLNGEKNKAEQQAKTLLEELQEAKKELMKVQEENDSLKAKMKRLTDQDGEHDYRLHELENQHYDDLSEIESLQERNNVLTYKVDDLILENTTLKRQLDECVNGENLSPKNSSHPPGFGNVKNPKTFAPFRDTTTFPAEIQLPIGSQFTDKGSVRLTPDIHSREMFSPGEEYLPDRNQDMKLFSRTIRKLDPAEMNSDKNDDHPLLGDYQYNPWGQSSLNLSNTCCEGQLFSNKPSKCENYTGAFDAPNKIVEPPKRLSARRSLDFSSLTLPH